jgi:paraquat-inducible protein B
VDSPVLYRGVRVGSVRELTLSPDARTIEVLLWIDPAHRHLVRANSKFWNAGGIGLDWGLIRGLSVKAGSLESLVAGGIAFATPTRAGDPVTPGFRFPLAPEPKPEWLEWSPSLPADSAGGAISGR